MIDRAQFARLKALVECAENDAARTCLQKIEICLLWIEFERHYLDGDRAKSHALYFVVLQTLGGKCLASTH